MAMRAARACKEPKCPVDMEGGKARVNSFTEIFSRELQPYFMAQLQALIISRKNRSKVPARGKPVELLDRLICGCQ
jgi:hypothetical protein